jgi:uncharacterized protein (TIGR02145 family)
MKSIIKIISAIALFLVCSQSAKAQITSFCGSDTIILNLDNYSVGSIQWQESYDGLTWKPIPNQNKSSYKFFTAEEKYYRAQIITSSCEEIYSRIAFVMQKASANAGTDQIIYGNKTTLSANKRSGATGKWKIISGSGATISDLTLPSPVFEGTISNSYELVWTLSNSCGATSDTLIVSFIQNQYKANYIVVDTTDTILSTIQELSDGIYHIRFSEAVTGINDSIMLIGIKGEGFLRKTLAVTYEGNNTYIFHTEQGMIDDLCIDGVFNLGDNSAGQSAGKTSSEQLLCLPTRKELTSDPRFRDMIFVYLSPSSQKLYSKAVKGEKAGASSDINLTFTNTAIGWTLDNTGSFLFSEQVLLNGTYSFVPNYKFDMLVKNKQLKYLKIDLDNAIIEKNLKTTFSTAVTGTIPGSDKQLVQKSLYKNSVNRIMVIGGVPVVTTTESELFINAVVSGSGISSIILEDKTIKHFSSGMLNEGGLTSTHENLTQTGTFKAGTTVTGDMVIETRLTPVIKSKLFGVDGPFVYVHENADALLCGATSGNNNTLWDADLEISMEMETGSKVTLSKQIIQTISAWFPIGIPQLIYIPEKIEMLAGNNQSGPSGSRLPQEFRVHVTDNTGYPVPKVEVRFEVTKGNGIVDNPVVLTDGQGIAQTYFSIGTSGTENEVRASAAGCVSGDIFNSPLIFRALSNSSGNSEDCKNSALAAGFKTNVNNTVEPYGILGILPYTYSTDGVTFSTAPPQVQFNSANGLMFYIRDGKGCEISKPWIPEDPCLLSDLNISVSGSGSSIVLSGTGGNVPYQFSIDSPSSFSSISVYTGLTDGTHTAYIKDLHQCIRQMSFIIGGTPGGGGGGGGLPVISVPVVTGQTETTATVSGTISVPGNGSTGETGFCWGVNSNPTIGSFHSAAGSGAGGFSIGIAGLDTATTYYVRIYTVTNEGVVYGNEVKFSTKNYPIRFNPNLTYGTLTDIEGNIYKTIQIGNQVWMAENLRTIKFNNGNQILLADNTWLGLTMPGYCWYNNDSTANKYIYGALYNGYTISTGNICPTSWHVPTDTEWGTLTNYLWGGAIAGIKLKEVGTSHWKDTNPSATNESGFTALPGSGRGHDASFSGLGQVGYWWSSTEIDQNRLWYMELKNISPGFEKRSEFSSKLFGFPVRCVKDGSPPVTLPEVSTSSVSGLTQNSAICGGQIIDDGGAAVTSKGVCWSTSTNPTIQNSKTTDGWGNGPFVSTLSGLSGNIKYYVRAYATSSEGTAYGNEISFTTPSDTGNGIVFNPNLTYGSVSDIDGNTYKTIQIGTQSWMAENLRTSKFNDGTSIPLVESKADWNNQVTAGYCWYNNDPATYKYIYGALYSWDASGSGRLCPTGWHVPSDEEWTALESFVNGNGKLIETGSLHWKFSPADLVTNETGFTALPAGRRLENGTFEGVESLAYWWNSTESTPTTAVNRWLHNNPPLSFRVIRDKRIGNSVRCIEGPNPPVTLPTFLSTAIKDITQNSALLIDTISSNGGGNITARGVCWSTNQNPTITESKTIDGSGIGNYTSNITGLTPNTTYYVRAYATNSAGTAYGNQITFKTLNNQTTGLVAYYPFNGNANDESGNGNNGTNHGALLTTDRFGIQDRAFSFNGIDSYIQVPQSETLNNLPLGDHSITAWVKFNSLSGQHTLVRKASDGSASEGGFLVQFYSYSGFTINHGLPTNVPSYAWNNPQVLLSNLQTNKWVHISIVYSRSLNLTSVYLDGVYIGSASHGSYVPLANTNDMLIGKMWAGLDQMNGCIDDIEIYNKELTSSEITTLFHEGNYGFISAKDIDGNTYNTVQIGTQIWMKENLKTTHYNTGSPIPYEKDNNNWLNLRSGARCYYDNDSSKYKNNLGALYNWFAINDSRNLCPTGWHVPSDEEWKTMEMYLGMSREDADKIEYRGINNEGGRLKEIGTEHWLDPNTGADNSTGFTALGGGYRYGGVYGTFYQLNHYGCFWSTDSVYRALFSEFSSINRNPANKNYGFSVRCLKDGSINISVPVLSSAPATSITQNSALCGGNITSDGGATVTARGVCWSTNQNPTIADFKTNDGTGIGSFTSYITGLTPNTNYYLRAYATNSAGTAYGEEKSIKTKDYPIVFNPNLTYGSVKDTDGNVYKTILIGNKVWMAENLKSKRDSKGNTIPLLPGTGYPETPGRYWTDFDSINFNGVSGALYNGFVINEFTCPRSWHVPTDTEFEVLLNYLGGAGLALQKLKETGAIHWKDGNSEATNESGFTALPIGNQIKSGRILPVSDSAGFWTSTEISPYRAYLFLIRRDRLEVEKAIRGKNFSYSIRCVKDTLFSTALPTISTTSVTSITNYSAITGGNITHDGGSSITGRGVCWSSLHIPTINDTLTLDGIGTGTFNSSINGLVANRTYFLRAYASNSAGTAYGNTMSFKTGSGLYIGQQYAGGIIFFIDGTGNHGMVCAQVDQSLGAMWGCFGIGLPGASGWGVGTGLQNTLDIINGCSEAGIAARLCYELELNGFSDWYLPSSDELVQLYNNLISVKIGNFSSGRYWSSTQVNGYRAMHIINSKGEKGEGENKNLLFFVRAVRSF